MSRFLRLKNRPTAVETPGLILNMTRMLQRLPRPEGFAQVMRMAGAELPRLIHQSIGISPLRNIQQLFSPHAPTATRHSPGWLRRKLAALDDHMLPPDIFIYPGTFSLLLLLRAYGHMVYCGVLF